MKIIIDMKLIEKLKQLFKKENNHQQIIGQNDCNIITKTEHIFSCDVVVDKKSYPIKIILYIYESINNASPITTSLNYFYDQTSENNLIYAEMYVKQIIDLHNKKHNSNVPLWISEKLFDDIKKKMQIK